MDHEDIGSIPSAPATPGTPGGPLFGGFRRERSSQNSSRGSLHKAYCGCFSVEPRALEDGTLPPLSCVISPPPVSIAQKVGAEFIGTLILMFAAEATSIVNQETLNSETILGCAAATGLTVMMIILSTGHISGAHLNPAVTIAFAALKHFPWKQVPVYIGTQVMASFCASYLLKLIFHPEMDGGVTVPKVGYGEAFALEFIISFILMFVVTAVSTDTRAVGELAGIAVGGTVMVTSLIAGPSTGASMNPVRSLGPAVALNNYKGIWIYLTAPILGTLAGAGVYTAVKITDEEQNKAAATPSFRH
ncbi:hypothetical protein Leryth_026071 [Lithospermum erythrorhizon]|uniref:Uncharacterized protein n=1 Tax=Lithospermum erythrorhizon TaxID=34254 RepID=A0AAV3RMR6_LITER|nr:hypothetical protein Leryth_026071 [Lithospermum erythrorhizon]